MSRAASGHTAGGAHDGDRPLFVLLGLALASVFWSIAALELFTAAFITLGIARQIRTAAPLPRGGSLPFLLSAVNATTNDERAAAARAIFECRLIAERHGESRAERDMFGLEMALYREMARSKTND